MIRTKSLFVIGLTAIAATVTSCKEANLFDENDYQEIVKNSFPVQNIDPLQDWSTIKRYSFRVGINYSGKYKLKFYSENPKMASARVLNTCFVDGGRTYNLLAAVPSILDKIYVAIAGEDGLQRTKGSTLTTAVNDIVFSEATSEDEIVSDASKQVDIPHTYTFCFESNFPQPGDYDFNDAVMGVKVNKTIENGNKYISIEVKSRAVGTMTRVAAAMRLSGIRASQVASTTYERSGDKYYFFPQYGKQDMLPNFRENNEFFTMLKSTDLVIPIYNDAHYFISDGATVAALPARFFYNTIIKEEGKLESEMGMDVSEKSQTFRFAVNNDDLFRNFSINDIDLFILEEFNGSVFEVHTQPYKTAEVLKEWANKRVDGGSPYNNNYPWALLIEGDFRYPVEGLNIGKSQGNVIGGAYLGFGQWAQHRNVSKDWYNHPQSSDVVY